MQERREVSAEWLGEDGKEEFLLLVSREFLFLLKFFFISSRREFHLLSQRGS